MLFLLAACLTADPATEVMPSEIRAYFDKQERLMEDIEKRTREHLTDLVVRRKAEPIAKKKAVWTAQINKVEKSVEAMEKQRGKPRPELSMPLRSVEKTEVGDVGVLGPGKVLGIVGERAVIKVNSRILVLDGIDAKDVHLVRPYNSRDLWVVTEINPKDVELRTYAPGGVGSYPWMFLVVKPYKQHDVDRWRAEYYSEMKQAVESK